MILTLGALVEDPVPLAVQSLNERDEATAQKVMQADFEVDKKEGVLKEECLKRLALHQPVAIDLRFIIAVLKINPVLERIADFAINIAEDAFYMVDGNIVRHKTETYRDNG